MTIINVDKYLRKLEEKKYFFGYTGKVTRVIGIIIEVKGIYASIGELCSIEIAGMNDHLLAEVVGFTDTSSLLMPLGDLRGISPGCKVYPTGETFKLRLSEQILAKVVDSLGNVLNGAELPMSNRSYPVQNDPPHPLMRKTIDEILTTGIRSIDAFLTCGTGQRFGIFAGSGVGKSTLLGMIARNSTADVNVIGLIGERGREVKEFIARDLGEEGLKRSVVVVSTSDQPALLRVKGALVTTTIAEFFRDRGKKVLLMIDSITRFAMAQREIGLAVGEPPTTKGYTPSVFALLPKILERAGNLKKGSITGIYSVLVDGDDMNEPIADAVRGILDGHIVLSRKLAAQNHFPAIDVLQSISRVMPHLTSTEHQKLVSKARNYLAMYEKNQDLINIGAYQRGQDAQLDRAIDLYPLLRDFLQQDMNEAVTFENTINQLKSILTAEG